MRTPTELRPPGKTIETTPAAAPREAPAAIKLVRQSLEKVEKALGENTAAVKGAITKRPRAYRFTFKRNREGFIEEVIATPIAE